MAKYLLLIYGDERRWDAETPAQRAAKDEAHRAFAAAAGPGLLSGYELESSATATTLRPTPTDGPFLETKEALGGYGYLAAARADFLRRLDRRAEAALAYTEAIALTGNDVERAFLVARLAAL